MKSIILILSFLIISININANEKFTVENSNKLNNQLASYYLNSSNQSAGIIPNARVSGNYTNIKELAPNVGIGIATLENWHANIGVLQLKDTGYIFGYSNVEAHVGENAYFDGSWKYIISSHASEHYMGDGKHKFKVAVSGTADAVITWIEAMIIENDGDISIPVGKLIVDTSHTPTSSTGIGTTGTIAWDANYIYICVATNTWKRIAISSW